MRHICKLGRTCRNCTEARTDEDGLYCVHDQRIGGWEYTRNPRNRALKCSQFINKKWYGDSWLNDDVMHWHFDEYINKLRSMWDPFRCL